MNLFFDVPDKYRYAHLADAIEFLPYGVTVDEFQHWVYANPNATPAERDAEWAALEEKYTPYKVKAAKRDGLGGDAALADPGHIFASIRSITSTTPWLKSWPLSSSIWTAKTMRKPGRSISSSARWVASTPSSP
jgi:hypothetical protein